MKKLKKIFIVLIFCSLIMASCFRIDRSSDSVVSFSPNKLQINNLKNDYGLPSTKLYNGVEYKLSRAQIGKYGGEIVTSTIGEGPKTFNP